MTTPRKPNLSQEQKLIREHDGLDGLPGYVVVVLERLRSGGVKFARIINPGERFRPFPPFLNSSRNYFAVAVNESVLSYSFIVPVSLDDDANFELPLRFHLTFRAADPRVLAELSDQDPLQRLIDRSATAIQRNFRSQHWESGKNPVREFEPLVLTPERSRLAGYAATLGIELIKLDLDRSSFELDDERDSSAGINEPDPTRAGGNVVTKGPQLESPGSLESAAIVASDAVACSVFAPRKARRGGSIMVQVFAHREEDEAAAKAMASEFDEKTQRLGLKRLDHEVERDSKLVFFISLAGLQIDEPTQSLIWRGQPESVQFDVQIPPDFVADQIVGTVYVTQDSVPFGHLKFLLRIENADAPAAQNDEPAEAENQWKRYQYAFISYASPDRPEVLKRVQMLARLHIDFFQDLLTLEPGDRWEQQLYKNIDRCDVFFLFWSTAARDSKWVMKEVRYALDRKRADKFAAPEIVPVIIEGPPPVAPPDELKDIHFNDVFIYFLN